MILSSLSVIFVIFIVVANIFYYDRSQTLEFVLG